MVDSFVVEIVVVFEFLVFIEADAELDISVVAGISVVGISVGISVDISVAVGIEVDDMVVVEIVVDAGTSVVSCGEVDMTMVV